MSIEKDDIDKKIQNILHSKNTSFLNLVKISGLKPSEDFQYMDLSRADFTDCNLNGFDFTGSQIEGAKFTGARIEGLMLDNKQIQSDAIKKAKDYQKYIDTLKFYNNLMQLFTERNSIKPRKNRNFTIPLFLIFSIGYSFALGVKTSANFPFLIYGAEFLYSTIFAAASTYLYMIYYDEVYDISYGENPRMYDDSNKMIINFEPEKLKKVCITGNENYISDYLQSNIYINQKTSSKGLTLLMKASYDGKIDIVNLLLNAGADPTIQDRNGATASDYVLQNKKNEKLYILLKNSENEWISEHNH